MLIPDWVQLAPSTMLDSHVYLIHVWFCVSLCIYLYGFVLVSVESIFMGNVQFVVVATQKPSKLTIICLSGRLSESRIKQNGTF